MYNEQLENLINMALMDGELAEKEKQVLFKKAESLGVDLDEFEIVLDAKLFEKKKNNHTSTAAPKSDKYGDVKKCPACGSIAESFSTTCKDCGTEFRNISSSKAMIEFQDKLEQGDNEKDIETIMNFNVPNTKQDIIEFLTLSISNYQNVTKDKLRNAWLTKIENLMMKMNLVFKENDPLIIQFQNKFISAKKTVRNKSIKSGAGSVLTKLWELFLLGLLSGWKGWLALILVISAIAKAFQWVINLF
jgi:hypothetical protein